VLPGIVPPGVVVGATVVAGSAELLVVGDDWAVVGPVLPALLHAAMVNAAPMTSAGTLRLFTSLDGNGSRGAGVGGFVHLVDQVVARLFN
jgi:hypothetical protein